MDFLKFGIFKNLMAQGAGHVVVWLVMIVSGLPTPAKILIGLAVVFLQMVFAGLASYFNPNGDPASVPYDPTSKS
jgi:hypothetical protein